MKRARPRRKPPRKQMMLMLRTRTAKRPEAASAFLSRDEKGSGTGAFQSLFHVRLPPFAGATRSSRSIPHQAQHFLAAAFVVQKTAEQAAGHHADARRAHAAPGHAAVLRVDHHRDAVRLQMVPDALRDLGGQPFLHLEPARIAVEDACEFRRSEEHTSELQSLMRISYAVFCLK